MNFSLHIWISIYSFKIIISTASIGAFCQNYCFLKKAQSQLNFETSKVMYIEIYIYNIYIIYIYIYVIGQKYRTSCAQVHEMPQSHCREYCEGTLFSSWHICIYICMYIYIYIYVCIYIYMCVCIYIYMYIYIYIHIYNNFICVFFKNVKKYKFHDETFKI